MKQKNRILCFAVVTVALLALPVAAQVKDHQDIKYPQLPEFKIDRPEMFELKNGMKIFLIEDHELPLMQINVQIRTGSNYEPAEKTGLGGIFGQVLREGGTSSMSGDEMDDYLEARAASVETWVAGDSGGASMSCLKEDFGDVFDLFTTVLRDPVFAEDKIELAKVQAKTGISRRNDDVGGIVGREFNRLIYGEDSALGRLTEYETIAAIERSDLVEWHKKYYHPNNVYLGVVGDFDTAKMKQLLAEKLGSWPRGPAFDEPEVAYRKSVKPGVYFVEKSDVTQANVRMGHLGIKTTNPDFFSVQVMNEVFGGGFASRLFSNVRSEKGLAYSVFGRVGSSLSREGVFLVGLSTKSSTMADSVDALKEEMVKIIDNPPDDREMKKAKDSILNSFVFNYDSKRSVLAQQMTYAYYGLPADFLETYRDKIEKVTREEVAAVAKKYIHPDTLALLVVGKAEDFDRPLSTFGKVTEIDITIPDPPVTAAAIARTPETLEAGSRIFSRAAKTIAGSSPKVESVTTKMKLAISMGGQAMALTQETSFKLPNMMRQAIQTPMGEQIVVVNGDEGFAAGGGQRQTLNAEQIADAVEQLGRELLVLTNHNDDPALEAVAAGTEKIDGTECEIVAVTLNGTESRLSVAPDGKILKQSYQGKHPFQRVPGLMEVMFSDYRPVDGRMIPHKRVMSFEGEELVNVTIDEIEVNPTLDGGLFEIASN